MSTSAGATAEAIEVTFLGAPGAELEVPPELEPPPFPKGKPPEPLDLEPPPLPNGKEPDPEPPAGRVCEVVVVCDGQNWWLMATPSSTAPPSSTALAAIRAKRCRRRGVASGDGSRGG
jgi:hypothetical protein